MTRASFAAGLLGSMVLLGCNAEAPDAVGSRTDWIVDGVRDDTPSVVWLYNRTSGGLCTGTCQPQCSGKGCGEDGCGGVCGQCQPGQSCENGKCIGACVPACPVAAIYDSHDSTPASQKDLIEANTVYRNGDADAMAQAEAIVAAHVAAHPELMAIPGKERAAAHT